MEKDVREKSTKFKLQFFAAVSTFLLAWLTVILCIMGGVFDFAPKKSKADEPRANYTLPAENSGEAGEIGPATPGAWTIISVSGEGGRVSPAGNIEVYSGNSAVFTITPDSDYKIKSLKIDGEEVSTTERYVFSEVHNNHSIHATFELINPPPEETDGDWYYTSAGDLVPYNSGVTSATDIR